MEKSFEESLQRMKLAAQKIQNTNTVAPNDVSVARLMTAEPMMVSESEDDQPAYSGDEWQLDDQKYRYYPEYTDENISEIDNDKNITLNEHQINLTQESNSQFIPFRLPRYYDGFDLSTAVLNIRFVNIDGGAGDDQPVNVYYSGDYIKFGWLVDARATAVAGQLNFEIQAIGKNSGGDDYIWKTKPCETLNILQSLEGNGVIEPDHSWVAGFLSEVTDKVAEAQALATDAWDAANEAAQSRDAAENAEAAARASADNAKSIIDNARLDLELSVGDAVDAAIQGAFEDYYKRNEVDDLLSNIDVTDELNRLKQEILEQLDDIDGLSAFTVEYDGKKMTFYNGNTVIKEIEIHSDPSEKWTTAFRESLEADIADKSVTYDLEYIPAETTGANNRLILQEITREGQLDEVRVPKTTVYIQAGGGTGGGPSDYGLKINLVTAQAFSITMDGKAEITYRFSGVDSAGDPVALGYYSWIVNNVTVESGTVYSGVNTKFDATDRLKVGTNTLKLLINDDNGQSVSKTYTIQKVDLRMESDFSDNTGYPIGDIDFLYTPYGAVEKEIYFVLDGKEIEKIITKASGVQTSYVLPAQEHGAHLLDVYSTALVGATVVESNHIVKDVLWYDETSDIPVIGCAQQNFTARQYDTTNIVFTVLDPTTTKPTVTIAVDGKVADVLTLDRNTKEWPYKATEPGNHTLTITCGNTVKTLTAMIEKLDINVEPVTGGLMFDFNPVGYSNDSDNRLWNDRGVAMTVSDNFDWVNGGYQVDESGDQYFCVKAGTTAVIDYRLFADDAKRNGKEFKVIFRTANIKKRDTSFITCMNGGIGLDMKVESANVCSNNGSLYSPYCENDIIEFEFNINKNGDIPLVLTYEDGVANRPMIYTSDATFWQPETQPITIGSPDCDVHIYRMKAYNTSLSDTGILANFITDARNSEEMIARYERNQIYDENNMLDPEVLAEACPDLRVIIVEAPKFTNDKSEKIDGTTVRMIYKNGDPVLDNWVCTGAKHSGQGTSSNEYGYAGRNMDLIMDGDISEFTLGDNITKSKTITLTRNSVPTDYLNIKVNIASSENANNAQMARRYNQYNPFVRRAKIDGRVKDCMEFFNCVVFIRETSDLIEEHREFADCETHFYAIGNVGDSKKTDDTRVNNKNDPKECVIEIKDYNVPLAEFPTGNGREVCSPENWKPGNSAYDLLYSEYEYKDGKFASFGAKSYEFRYEMKKITDEQREANINSWREMYRFVVTSDDETFHKDLKKYFVVDSALYYYLYTERYCMVDNRAKNSFWHYGKVYISAEEAANLDDLTGYIVDDEQASFNDGYRWNLAFGYDFDTALGIDNTGKLVLTYGKEDVDFYVDGDPSSSYIYRAAESTFFSRLRDLFYSELQAMFKDRETAGAWSADDLIRQWDNAQNQFPEELWRLDVQRKYVRTYRGISVDNSIVPKDTDGNPRAESRFLTSMLNGRKRYQRRMFERNQELYMATKYFGNVATTNNIMLRFNNPKGSAIKPDFTLYLTPYSDMYIGISWGAVSPTNFRAKAGVEYAIPYPLEMPDGEASADITLIYGASFIQAIGNLSKCFVGENNFSQASRLQSLVIGSDEQGYQNPYMTKIELGNNRLLEYLDIRNTSAMNEVVDMSQCGNLVEIHAEGSSAPGMIFANGGRLERAYLPALKTLTMKNLNYLEEFEIANYNNLQTLVVENTPFIDTYDIVTIAPALWILRLVGIDWTSDDTTVLQKVYGMRGIDAEGNDSMKSVLEGKAYVRSIFSVDRDNFHEAWPELALTYPPEGLIEQHTVTFVNTDGVVLDVQYIIDGEWPEDPTMRAEDPITPTIPMTNSHYFVFAGWDKPIGDRVFEDKVYRAKYDSYLREFTITYRIEQNNTILQQTTVPYGTYVEYDMEQYGVPTYTAMEDKMIFYMFRRWDMSGYVTEDKVVTAEFYVYKYDGGLKTMDFSEIAADPAKLYALTQLVKAGEITLPIEGYIEEGDSMSFTLGHDIEYDDINSDVLIAEETSFDGTNYIDTGIALFEEDRDFMLAIDYKLHASCPAGGVLMQCLHPLTNEGIELWHNKYAQFTWNGKQISGTSSDDSSLLPVTGDREMLVIRHRKGSADLMVYRTNMKGSDVLSTTITAVPFSTSLTKTLVFGCGKDNRGNYVNGAIGTIYWAKLWYIDLGDTACRSLASWVHEPLTMQIADFEPYALTSDDTQSCIFSLIAKNLIGRAVKWNAGSPSSNIGGWAECDLRTYVNTRVYKAMPQYIRALMQQVQVVSSIGNSSTKTSVSDCYIFAPAHVELFSAFKNTEAGVIPYKNEGLTIAFMTEDAERQCATYDGVPQYYWLRSPHVWTANDTYLAWYVKGINTYGRAYSGKGANDTAHLRIMFAL